MDVLFLQAQTFHLPVPEKISLEDAIKNLFDSQGEAIENVKCQDCDQAVTIRKLISIIDPKDGIIVVIKRCQWNKELKARVKNNERIPVRAEFVVDFLKEFT